MDAAELDENWKRACRGNNLINRFPEPQDANGLVEAVLGQIRGITTTPDMILRGLAMGFSSSDYEVSGEARYLQLALLVTEATKAPDADPRVALDVLTVLGQAAMSVLIETWRGEAEVDRLTRLGNRRKMEAVVAAHSKAGTRFVYASIDADGLKAINDSQGHHAGDQLLRTLGDTLEREIQPIPGAAFRYGGDEFGVVAVEESPSGVLGEALQRADDKLAALGYAFSAGVAAWPDDDDDAATVIDIADRRMYDIKRAKKEARAQTEAAAEAAAAAPAAEDAE